MHDSYFDMHSDGIIKVNSRKLDALNDFSLTYAHPFTTEYDGLEHTNRLLCQLDHSTHGKCFEIQVELMDTYRTINKATPFSQVMITPEFFGS
jgi:hypothetical protein